MKKKQQISKTQKDKNTETQTSSISTYRTKQIFSLIFKAATERASSFVKSKQFQRRMTRSCDGS